MQHIDDFFWYARERQNILLRRRAGEPRPWTEDWVLHHHRFCNIFREDDAVTTWFREHVRGPMSKSPDVLLATVVFRWFNRITSGEAIFNQIADYRASGRAITAWEWYLETGSTEEIKTALLKHIGPKGPFVTGAYIIKTPEGYTKLNGVLQCLEWFWQDAHQPSKYPYIAGGQLSYNWRAAAVTMGGTQWSLEDTWGWLRKFRYLGDFMAYEIVTDLRHTDLLSSAPDIMTWANAGPGAVRGLHRIHGRPYHTGMPKHQSLAEMQTILGLSRHPDHWPAEWQPWEMRDVEHTLCEYDKWQRAHNNEGRPRGVYK